MVKEFLLLEEITKSPAAVLQDEKKDASVELQDLVCYWDKVRYLVLTGVHMRNALSQFTRLSKSRNFLKPFSTNYFACGAQTLCRTFNDCWYVEK